MRSFIATFLLLWGSVSVAASQPTAALVTGDVIRAGLVMESAEVVGLTDDGQMLTQGLATKNGQSVQFVALLDKNDQVQFSLSDGDTWPNEGIVADVHASQLLFDGSFLVHGTSSGRPVIYRVDPTGQPSAVFDCETPSLNESFCSETNTPELTHDALGTVLVVAEDSAWRHTGTTYQRVFDFQVGEALPLGIGNLFGGVSCTGQAPISDWMLDGKGGVVAVVSAKPSDQLAGPAILRQSASDEFSIAVNYVEPTPGRLQRCALGLYGVDLWGMVFRSKSSFEGVVQPTEDTSWIFGVETGFINGSGELRGAVSGLYSLGMNVSFHDVVGRNYWVFETQRFDDRRIVDFSADVARGAAPAGIVLLDDGARVLLLGTRPERFGRQVLMEGQQIEVRSSPWTVSQMRLTAFTAGLYSGSATSNGALAFVISDAISGKVAIMRVAPHSDMIVNSRGDSSTVRPSQCETGKRVWDGRPECTVRAAFEAATSRETTSIETRLMRNDRVRLSSPLEVSTHVDFLGPADVGGGNFDLFSVQRGSLKMSDLKLTSAGNCVNADEAQLMSLTNIEMDGCAGFGIRSIRSGPVDLTGVEITESRIAVYIDGSTPDDGPLLQVTDSEFSRNEGGVYATGSITVQDLLIHSIQSAGLTMDGTETDVMTLKPGTASPTSEGVTIGNNAGPGVQTLQGKLVLEGAASFSGSHGPGIDAAGSVEFRNPVPYGVRIHTMDYPRMDCRALRFTDHEPRFDPIRCAAGGIRLRTPEPTSVVNISLSGTTGPGIIAEGPLSLESLRILSFRGPAVFSSYAGPETAVTLNGHTIFRNIHGPIVQTSHGNVVMNQDINFEGENGGFDVGGNIIFSTSERSVIRGLTDTACHFWVPARERTVAKKCGFSPMISHATTGTNSFENVDFINNRGVAIWAKSTVELRHVAIVGNDGGVIASSPNDAIILHEDVRILGNQGPGLVAKQGNIKALAPFRVERNEGAGIIVQNGDFVFENDSDTPAKIHHNAFGEACAPVGDQEFYPVYDRCIRAGLFVPNGSVISSGIEVTENVGEGIAADQVELLSSTVCGNSGAQIVSRTEVLDDVELCNKIVDRKSSDDDGCTTTPGLVSPMMLLIFLGFRRRRRFRRVGQVWPRLVRQAPA